jgi:hypothetical protein
MAPLESGQAPIGFVWRWRFPVPQLGSLGAQGLGWLGTGLLANWERARL